MEKAVRLAAGDDAEFNLEEYKEFIHKMRAAKNKWRATVPWLPHTDVVCAFYNLAPVQGFVATVIILNFLVMVLMAEADP